MPTTVGVILLFLGTFAGCVYWATSGKTDKIDNQRDQGGTPAAGKSS